MAANLGTYGEFIDAVEGTKCIYAQSFLDEWKALATVTEWAEYRPMLLTRELVVNLAEDMARYFQALISGTCTDALYRERVKAGHDFLRWVHDKAVALGLDVKLQEIDTAMTPTESIVLAGTAAVVPIGTTPSE